MNRTNARWIARSLAALPLVAGACTTWRPQTASAPAVVAAEEGRGVVRIFRNDESVMILSAPRVVGDSIVGMSGNPPTRAAVAVADVRRIDRRRVSATRTGGLAVGTVVVVTLAAVGAAVIALLSAYN